jgi:phytoene/squalene synthetase
MVFGDDPKKAELLMPLGRAVRRFYTLRDYEADIAAGFVNVPRESIDAYGITGEDLPNRFSAPVRAWFHEEASSDLQLLDEHKRVMKREKFAWKGRIALPLAYTRPTKAYLEAVLADQK